MRDLFGNEVVEPPPKEPKDYAARACYCARMGGFIPERGASYNGRTVQRAPLCRRWLCRLREDLHIRLTPGTCGWQTATDFMDGKRARHVRHRERFARANEARESNAKRRALGLLRFTWLTWQARMIRARARSATHSDAPT